MQFEWPTEMGSLTERACLQILKLIQTLQPTELNEAEAEAEAEAESLAVAGAGVKPIRSELN